MKLIRASLAVCCSIIVIACEIPVVIDGEGDVFSRTGKRDCGLTGKAEGVVECRHRYFMSMDDWILVYKGLLTPEPLQETYYAIPKRGQAVRSMRLSEPAHWSFDCRLARSSECYFDLPPAIVQLFVKLKSSPVLTATFEPRTDQLTINGISPKKIYASGRPQRIIIKGEGFLYGDKVTLVDLSRPATKLSIVPLHIDDAAGLMVIEATFTSTPSRWLLRIKRSDNSESMAIPFDVKEEADTIPLTDTVVVNGIEWVQPLSLHYFLYPLSRREVRNVCPYGVCMGSIRGYDLSGWTWATADDAAALFNHYRGYSGSIPVPATVSKKNSTWAPAILRDFAYATYNVGTGRQFSAIFGALYDGTVPVADSRTGALQIVDGISAADADIFSTRGRISGACCNPPLLYRTLPKK